MSERLPYEEQLPQQLRDFPLPDEDFAWADMKRRLEKDDDDGMIVWWRRGCLGWGLLLLALLGAGLWWFVNKRNDDRTNKQTETAQPATRGSNGIAQPHLPDSGHTEYGDTINESTNKSATASLPVTWPAAHDSADHLQISTRVSTKKIKEASGEKIAASSHRNRNTKPGARPQKTPLLTDAMTKPATTTPAGETQRPELPDTISAAPAPLIPTGDSSFKKPKDSIKKAIPVSADSSKTKDKEQKSETYFFSAGIALYQQLPIAGQKAVSYSSAGRGFGFADYIPSVYLRFNKKDRWFIQGEFRYGAPQYNKPLTYSRIDDSIGATPGVSEKQLQKTYYHQLPFSFNVYLRPNSSAGAGLILYRFSKTIVQETFRLGDASIPPDPFDTVISQKKFVSRDPVKEGLSKSYFQALIESQYQWKKFSFGARYTFGLTPYIRFTLPNEPQHDQKNQSLQIFIRYQLWAKSLNE